MIYIYKPTINNKEIFPFQSIREQEERENAENSPEGGGVVGGRGGDLRVSGHQIFSASVQRFAQVSRTMAAPPSMLTDREMDCITTVFRSFETGLRGATIYPSVSAELCLISPDM